MQNKRLIGLAVVGLMVFWSLPMGMASPLDDVNKAVDEVVTPYVVGFHRLPADIEPGDIWEGAIVTGVNEWIHFITVDSVDPMFETKVQANDEVRYIHYDDPHAFGTQYTPNDPRLNEQWGFVGANGIDAEAAWDDGLGSTSAMVAVLDTGLEKSHSDIGNYLQGYDFINNDNDPNDDCGHGTHVAGTVGALTDNGIGVAGTGQVTILPVKVLAPSGWLGCSGSFSAIANGITWATDQGADVISMSLGGSSGTQELLDAVNYAWNNGVLVVAAAGNDNGGPVGYPAKYANAMAVSALDSDGGLASYSNVGPEIEITGPGTGILSTYTGGGYSSSSGTSMATPHVSGVAGLVLSADGTLTNQQLRDNLKDNAVDMGLSANEQGSGNVNAANSVAAAGGGSPPPDPQCSDGIDNDGDGEIDYPADDGCTDANDDDETDPPGGGPTQVHYEDWDDGLGGGYTVNSGTLWHLSTGCGGAHTGSYKAVWADSGSCTYDVGDTGADWLKSPAISLSGFGTATAMFYHWFETESYSGGAYDVLQAQYSCNDSSWTTLEQWDSRDPNILSWTQESYDVSSCAGGNLWLRWHADSIDGVGNNYDGWRVDTVEVTAE